MQPALPPCAHSRPVEIRRVDQQPAQTFPAARIVLDVFEGVSRPFRDWFNASVTSVRSDLAARWSSSLSAEERTAALTMQAMLASDKLGGADGVFNDRDVAAIVKSLLKDRPGLEREVVGKLIQEGKDDQAEIALETIQGQRGFAHQGALVMIRRGLAREIRNGLREGGVLEPSDIEESDDTTRTIDFDELRRFEASAAVLKARNERSFGQLGLDITFPGGISAQAMQFLLDGKLGLPPDARLTLRAQ